MKLSDFDCQSLFTLGSFFLKYYFSTLKVILCSILLQLKSQLFVSPCSFPGFSHIWCSKTLFGLFISVDGCLSAIWENP